MERSGITIDPRHAAAASRPISRRPSARLEDEIAALAGERFNLGSPKQLGDILFGKMGLPGATKTPTGAWSTRANVLEELAEAGASSCARKILEWRQVSKLKSTYTDALPGYVNPDDRTRAHDLRARRDDRPGRLVLLGAQPAEHPDPHARKGARSARPSSPTPGHKLVSADYSQIELRLLAEIADVPALRQAFQRRHRHPCDDGLGNVRRAGQGHAAGRAPPRQGDQFRHHLRHLGVRPRQPARHRPRRGRRLHQEIFRALPRHPRLHGGGEGVLPHARLRHDAVRPQDALSRHQGEEPVAARLQRARRDQCPAAGHRRRHHPPRHDPHARRAAGSEACRPDAAAGARRAGVRGAGPGGREDPAGGRPRDGICAAARRLAHVPLQVDARAADNWDEAH